VQTLATAPSIELTWFHAAVALGFVAVVLLLALTRAMKVRILALRTAASARAELATVEERVALLERSAQRDLRTRDDADVGGARGSNTLNALPGVFAELAGAHNRSHLCAHLGRAIERITEPAQWMVFLADPTRDGEFVLVAGAADDGQAWPEGAVLNERHGRLGHAVKRGVPMSEKDFRAEPPIVRERLRADEPRGFIVDLAVPVLVGDDVAGVFSIGRASVPDETVLAFAKCAAAMMSSALRCMDARDLAKRIEDSDDLTGLGNRRWFLAQAAETLYRNRERGVQMSLAVFGVDHLRRYFAEQKVAATGRLQRSVADIAKSHLRQGALLARWSEDEFVALLPGCDARATRQVFDTVRRDVTEAGFPGGSQQPGGAVTVSAGVAVCPWDGVQLDDLLDAAYAALEVARSRGGDQVTNTESRASDSSSFSFAPDSSTDSAALEPPPDRVRLPVEFGSYEDLTASGPGPGADED